MIYEISEFSEIDQAAIKKHIKEIRKSPNALYALKNLPDAGMVKITVNGEVFNPYASSTPTAAKRKLS